MNILHWKFTMEEGEMHHFVAVHKAHGETSRDAKYCERDCLR